MPRKRRIVQSSREEHRNMMREQSELRDTNTTYRKCQQRVFSFLERPDTKVSVVYHVLNLTLILGSIITSVLSTIESFDTKSFFRDFILYYELTLLSWFTLEYISRMWCCSIVCKYKGWRGRLRFAKTFYMLVDAFVILSTLTTAVLQMKRSYFTMLRITRFLQVFRILRWDRQRGDLSTMGRVVYKHQKELVTCYFVGFIILFGGTYIVYIVEKSALNPTINNMASGLYWAMITVTSVGYGDISPVTWAGKIITGVFALVGCAFFALPAGILGSGFALQVAKQKKQKRYTKVRNPAAIVIQTLWRNHAVKKSQHHLQGTWNYLLPQVVKARHQPRSYYSMLPGIHALYESQAFDGSKANTRESRMKYTERKWKKMANKRSQNPFVVSNTAGTNADYERLTKMTNKDVRAGVKRESLGKFPASQLIDNRYIVAVKFILRVKYWTSIRSFKRSRYPFVNVQDIMEKNSHNHIETLTHLKEMRQCIEDLRLELQEIKNTSISQKTSHVNSTLETDVLKSEAEEKKPTDGLNKDWGENAVVGEINDMVFPTFRIKNNELNSILQSESPV